MNSIEYTPQYRGPQMPWTDTVKWCPDLYLISLMTQKGPTFIAAQQASNRTPTSAVLEIQMMVSLTKRPHS